MTAGVTSWLSRRDIRSLRMLVHLKVLVVKASDAAELGVRFEKKLDESRLILRIRIRRRECPRSLGIIRLREYQSSHTWSSGNA